VVPPFVGYIAHASSIRWSFGIIALFGAMIVLLVSKIKEDSRQHEEATVVLPEN